LNQEPTVNAPSLSQAYAACRTIARREAKNFYYAFIALPPARRNAICAIYAFMRQADDLADDESLPRDERRRRLDAWLSGWARPPPILFLSRCVTQQSGSQFH
jgi:phytoene synthase